MFYPTLWNIRKLKFAYSTMKIKSVRSKVASIKGRFDRQKSIQSKTESVRSKTVTIAFNFQLLLSQVTHFYDCFWIAAYPHTRWGSELLASGESVCIRPRCSV